MLYVCIHAQRESKREKLFEIWTEQYIKRYLFRNFTIISPCINYVSVYWEPNKYLICLKPKIPYNALYFH